VVAVKVDVMLARTEIETENVTVFTVLRAVDERWKTTIAVSKHVLDEFAEPPRTTVLGIAYSVTEESAVAMHEKCLDDVYRGSWQEDVQSLLTGLAPVWSPDVSL
jgi:hypothetical protein